MNNNKSLTKLLIKIKYDNIINIILYFKKIKIIEYIIKLSFKQVLINDFKGAIIFQLYIINIIINLFIYYIINRIQFNTILLIEFYLYI